jgi:VWFA-related protein
MKRFAIRSTTALMILLFATILVATVAGPARAETAVAALPPTTNPFGQSIDVRVVNVEGVVTDRKGRRVPGLAATDFRLLVDGKEVPIDYFTEIAAGAAAAPVPAREDKAPATASAAAGAPTAAAAAAAPSAPAAMAAPGEAVGTNYLVYIDDQFSIQARRNLVLQRIAADLGRLGPHDQVSILSFDGRKVTRLNDWTGDRKTLEGAFATAEKRSTAGLLALADLRSDGDSGLIQEYGPGVISRSWGISVGMRAVVAAMRGTPTPPGRKVMLFLNGGWGLPEPELSGRGAPSADYYPEAKKVFAPVFETANLLGYTLYTIEVPQPSSVSINTGADVRFTGPTSFGSNLENLGRNDVLFYPQLAPERDFISTSFGRSVHENLEVMARQTGGKAILNSAWLNAFERVTADTSSYYWLGFTPQWKADGSHHEIRLEVRRPGLEVRSRSGFTDLTRETEAQVAAESRLLYGSPLADRPLGVTAGVLHRVSYLRRELPVTVVIPADALAPQVEEGVWSLEGTLSIAILDSNGRDPRWRTLPVHFKSNKLPPAGATTSVQTVLELPRSTRQVIFAVGGEHGEVRAWSSLDLQSVARE